MTVSELKDQLASQISTAEAEALRNSGELTINDFNLQQLRLRKALSVRRTRRS